MKDHGTCSLVLVRDAYSTGLGGFFSAGQSGHMVYHIVLIFCIHMPSGITEHVVLKLLMKIVDLVIYVF